MRPPDALLDVRQFAGSGLSGPQATALDEKAFGDAWSVRARVILTEKPPGDAFEPVGPHARLVIGQDPTDVLAPSSQLTFATRSLWLKTDDSLEAYLNKAGQWQELRTLNGAVAVGSTASIDIALPQSAEKSAEFPRRRLRVEVSRTAEGNNYELALQSDELSSKDLSPVREKIVLDRYLAGGTADRVALAVPMAWPSSSAKFVVIDLLVTSSADAELVNAAKSQINTISAGVALRLKLAPATPEEAAIAAGLYAINSQPPNRGSLTFLADQTGAVLTKNVVLAADEAAIPLIVDEVRKRSANLPKADKNTVGWMLDRATIAVYGVIAGEEGNKLLPAIQGALVAYAGQVGLQPDLLQSLAAQSVNSRDLDAHIIAEHRIDLEDTSPALRVRAYDWLADRGQAPPGYDPLASPRARRAALEKYQEATTGPSASNSNPTLTQPATQPATQPTTAPVTTDSDESQGTL